MYVRIENKFEQKEISVFCKPGGNLQEEIPAKGRSRKYNLSAGQSLIIPYKPDSDGLDKDKDIVYLNELDGHIGFHYLSADSPPTPVPYGRKRKLKTSNQSGNWELEISKGSPSSPVRDVEVGWFRDLCHKIRHTWLRENWLIEKIIAKFCDHTNVEIGDHRGE